MRLRSSCDAGGRSQPLQQSRAAAAPPPQASAPKQPPKPALPVNAVAVANFGLSIAPPAPAAARPRPLPAPRGRRVASFTPRQLQQLSDALEAVTKPELKVTFFFSLCDACYHVMYDHHIDMEFPRRLRGQLHVVAAGAAVLTRWPLQSWSSRWHPFLYVTPVTISCTIISVDFMIYAAAARPAGAAV